MSDTFYVRPASEGGAGGNDGLTPQTARDSLLNAQSLITRNGQTIKFINWNTEVNTAAINIAYSGYMLIGDGMNRWVLDNQTADHTLILGSVRNGITIKDMTIKNGVAAKGCITPSIPRFSLVNSRVEKSLSATGYGCWMTASPSFIGHRYIGCEFLYCPWGAIVLQTGIIGGALIKDCSFIGNGIADISPCDNCIIENCVFFYTGSGQKAISCGSADDVVVRDCTFVNWGEAPIDPGTGTGRYFSNNVETTMEGVDTMASADILELVKGMQR